VQRPTTKSSETHQLRILYYVDAPRVPHLYGPATDNWMGYQRWKAVTQCQANLAQMKKAGATNSDGKPLPADLFNLTNKGVIDAFVAKTSFFKTAKMYKMISPDIPHHANVVKYFAMDEESRMSKTEEVVFEAEPEVRTSGSGLLQAFLVKHGDMPDPDAKEVKKLKESKESKKESKKEKDKEEEREKSPEKRTHKKKKKKKKKKDAK
jgi:hypothetical protein